MVRFDALLTSDPWPSNAHGHDDVAVLAAVFAHRAKLAGLGEAARALREKEGRRDEQFRKSVEAQRERSKLLERKFEEAFEKVKDEPPGPPPPRDIDLD